MHHFLCCFHVIDIPTDNLDSYTESSGEDDYSSDSYYSEEDEEGDHTYAAEGTDVTPTRQRLQEDPQR